MMHYQHLIKSLYLLFMFFFSIADDPPPFCDMRTNIISFVPPICIAQLYLPSLPSDSACANTL